MRRRKRVGQYSLGMRQRLGIAQALLGDPQVLLLDEPANGLDPEGIHWVRRLLRSLADEGRAVLVSSHLLGEVARLADDVIVIRRGRFVTQASVAELTGSAGGGAVQVASLDDPPLARALQAGRCRGRRRPRRADGHRARTGRRRPDRARGGRGAAAAAAHVAELEDVFIELTGGGGIA
jgi:ABC-2 type transport system ATP-binding protein